MEKRQYVFEESWVDLVAANYVVGSNEVRDVRTAVLKKINEWNDFLNEWYFELNDLWKKYGP